MRAILLFSLIVGMDVLCAMGQATNDLPAHHREVQWIDVDVQITACRDPKDDKFLSLAVSGQAIHIVTGDADLLALHAFQGVRIVTPGAFLAAE